MTAGTPTGTGHSVLVLSSLYPSSAFPGSGPFVRDEVRELARRNTLAVVAPLRVAPLRPATARRVLAVPKVSLEDGISVIRPWFPGIPVGGLTIEPRLWALRLGPTLRRAYREIDGELVHAHFAFPDGFAAARFASHEKVPFVLTIWGSDVLQLGKRRRVRKLLTRTFAQAQAVIAVSRELAERAEALGAPSERLHVIIGGVPYQPRVAREQARSRLGIDRDTLCVLWVGGLVPVKQPADAIHAFDELRATTGSERKLLLAMIGDGRLRSAVLDLIGRRGLDGVVRLPGHCSRETVWLWHSAADVLVNSSRSEGTPRAVLEALGAGTPVVAYPLEGVRAAVDEVRGGRVAAARTPSALAAAICAELAVRRDRRHPCGGGA